MLRYSVKLNKDNIKRENMSWGEKFLSQDLSYVSGVTSTDYHLEKYTMMPSTNDLVSSDSTLSIESENVIRSGYCIVRDKIYHISTIQIDNSDKPYIEFNGKYYYQYENDNGEQCYKIDNVLSVNKDNNNDIYPIEKELTVVRNGDSIKFDTIYWIENNTVTIDGVTYDYDSNEKGIRLGDGDIISDYSVVTDCSEIKFVKFDNKDIKEVTKFKLTKSYDERRFDTSKISYCKYVYFIKFSGQYYNVIEEDGGFTCYVMGDKCGLYFTVGNNVDDGNGDSYHEFTRENLIEFNKNLNNAYNYDSLKDINLYVKVKCDDGYKYVKVEHDVINSNYGNRILLQITDDYSSFGIGDIIRVGKVGSAILRVFKDKDDEPSFVIYNGNRYNLIDNLCDKVVISNHEYSVSYPNGRKEGSDALVDIDGSNVAMKIYDGKNGKQLKPYTSVIVEGKLNVDGNVVEKTKIASYDVYYDLKEYDGVSINGKNYMRYNEVSDGNVVYYDTIDTDLEESYILEIDDMLGSNNLICKAYLPTYLLSQETEEEINSYIIQVVITNSTDFYVNAFNKIFGIRSIDPYLPFYKKQNSVDTIYSSDYYYNLFKNLVLFSNIGYISVKFPMVMKDGGDTIQDDIISKEFFEYQKKLAINKIIDMEKDVYVPKFIPIKGKTKGKYSGSSTTFKSLNEIRVNLHFRTRDLSNWKVIENGGWFVTDYYPYADMTKKDELKQLMEASDLVGLLDFTNNDVYYQKSKLAKSFLRLSYYDSTDPQTQTLLATSTVFVDEHALFKKYIDNSRKNVHVYKTVSSNKDELVDTSKITVKSELTDSKNVVISNNDGIGSNSNVIIDENVRLSSRFKIFNKYDTDTSSEGFYIYMFKDYSKKLYPKQIFMTVEFNHAGVGLSLPFIKPMSWKKVGDNEELTPQGPLGLNSEELKDGILLEQKYAQDYIPMYGVYDFKNKEYAYVFDNRYVDVNEEEGVANLNLFELKIKDESNDENASTNNIERYVIDSNIEESK